MEKRYSQMTPHELNTEIASLSEKARKAEQHGIINELAVLERKIAMAKAYLLNPEDFTPGETYRVEGSEDGFIISYVNGVFAWGYRTSAPDQEEALPISVLREQKQA
ncbi:MULTISPECIES: YfhH family protein [Bacillus]|uniref:YfhH family protein n=1 Tax=Bacillus vallismortis TaxID=72361 RepID=A0AAP3FXW8_BACVA|nr:MULTISPECIES: YfhH family protein [Bacillus]MBG9770242.1 hypothetical protein [Bacillus vallismortis]MCI3986983.1 YfhH family protein [Bacillus vallismortis]MCY8309613.1 YfhH family protein [Bacillus vallismortis]MCY8317329.1 YfhH family protein [Bacillus vallismortis]MCY8426054.1 YfhH family protein [Bacillus vallismortis]